ncbi:MAG TPA: nuclear transport factor 2 family protein [Acidimicrobiia bacterium]|nr:nuclear transport factor 2 family protein [Acidimicrobiia bacterium]
MSNTDVVRSLFEAYLAQDEATARRLIADDFTFTSPQDDHIDKAAFLERCFPTATRVTSQEIVELASVGDDGVFILYEYELQTGARHRNAEFITVRDGHLVETQVFFGGQVYTT